MGVCAPAGGRSPGAPRKLAQPLPGTECAASGGHAMSGEYAGYEFDSLRATLPDREARGLGFVSGAGFAVRSRHVHCGQAGARGSGCVSAAGPCNPSRTHAGAGANTGMRHARARLHFLRSLDDTERIVRGYVHY